MQPFFTDIFTSVNHPQILCAVYIDGDAYRYNLETLRFVLVKNLLWRLGIIGHYGGWQFVSFRNKRYPS